MTEKIRHHSDGLALVDKLGSEGVTENADACFRWNLDAHLPEYRGKRAVKSV